MTHPLDRAAWLALNGPQSHLAVGEGRARRFDPAYTVFAGVPDHSDASLSDLSALIRAYGDVSFLDPDPPMSVPGVRVASQEPGVQMVAMGLKAQVAISAEIVELGDEDSADMMALAQLTQPGPFSERTHQLGAFVGVRHQGKLIAMAGERMKPAGFTEVSAVCTHPDYRRRRLAAQVTQIVVGRILARREIPFLHVYASNTGAISLYERLGFFVRQEVLMTRLTAA